MIFIVSDSGEVTELPYTTDVTSEGGLSLCEMTTGRIALNYEDNCCFSIGPQTTYDGAREKCMNFTNGHLIKLAPPEIYVSTQIYQRLHSVKFALMKKKRTGLGPSKDSECGRWTIKAPRFQPFPK